MKSAKPVENIGEDNWSRLQQVAERFEQDCAASFPRTFDAYLTGYEGRLHKLLLEELVRLDLEQHWKRQQPARIETYIAKYPELGSAGCVVRLMQEEYRIRHHFGDKPGLDEYGDRFPSSYSAFVEAISNFATDAGAKSEVARTSDDDREPPPLQSLSGSAANSSSAPPEGLGRIKLLRRIGKGGFGEVWEAAAPGGVPIAVKRVFGSVPPRMLERERSSLDLICSGKFRHPFLLQVFGWWLEEGQLHIAMELADGTLDEKLKHALKSGQQGLPLSEVRQVMIDAAAALDFLNHERNILHRDVKPANMLLMARRLKLGDFGLSRMTENLAMASGRTVGAGTPIFIAPEIIEGYQSLHSDQYSLAVSYYMMRTGEPVFKGRAAEIRRQHLSIIPPLESTLLNNAEKEVLLKALRKIPDERFANNTEFVEALVSTGQTAKSAIATSHVSTVDQDAFGEFQSSLTEQPSTFDAEATLAPPDVSRPAATVLGSSMTGGKKPVSMEPPAAKTEIHLSEEPPLGEQPKSFSSAKTPPDRPAPKPTTTAPAASNSDVMSTPVTKPESPRERSIDTSAEKSKSRHEFFGTQVPNRRPKPAQPVEEKSREEDSQESSGSKREWKRMDRRPSSRLARDSVFEEVIATPTKSSPLLWAALILLGVATLILSVVLGTRMLLPAAPAPTPASDSQPAATAPVP